MNDALPLRAIIKQIITGIEDGCLICGKNTETTEHLFFKCDLYQDGLLEIVGL